MALERKLAKPAGITNEAGQPHIVVEVAGITIAAAPPPKDQGGAAPRAPRGRRREVRDPAEHTT